MKDCRGYIFENAEVAEELRLLTLELPDVFSTPLPGQFVNLRCGEGTDPLLRRPFSVHFFKGGDSPRLGVLYAPVGRWTRQLASLGKGREVMALGPLGKAFSPGDEETSILVAGGRGVAPLTFLADALAGAGGNPAPLVGARAESGLYWAGSFPRSKVSFITEDGSAGARGLVTDLLERRLAETDGGVAVYCCGPVKMLRKICEMCLERGVPCQASVETVFACGLGVCRGCGVPGAGRDARYLMACTDGPVLRAEDVDWEEFSP